ncbi:hypothetical protein VP01_1425g1 [Puccinia sorghi]|uniref:Uncharacterized protein n=1 Tax=Puccinia sorghi TaxID=27349 RepID=A0A0L6VKI6_9BASI|nr:hypothetical protein VP01_1425g1 [Puccinia sorghi]
MSSSKINRVPISSCFHPSNVSKSDLNFTCKLYLIYLLLIQFFLKLYLNFKRIYGLHFMTLIFFTRTLNKTNTTLTKNKNLWVGKLEKIPWFGLKGKPNILCKPILFLFPLEDDPLAATLPQACLQIFQGYCRKPLRPQMASFNHNLWLSVMVIRQTYISQHSCQYRITTCFTQSNLFLLLALPQSTVLICFKHDIKLGFNQVKKVLYSPKIRLNLCTQLTTKTQQVSAQYMSNLRERTRMRVPCKQPGVCTLKIGFEVQPIPEVVGMSGGLHVKDPWNEGLDSLRDSKTFQKTLIVNIKLQFFHFIINRVFRIKTKSHHEILHICLPISPISKIELSENSQPQAKTNQNQSDPPRTHRSLTHRIFSHSSVSSQPIFCISDPLLIPSRGVCLNSSLAPPIIRVGFFEPKSLSLYLKITKRRKGWVRVRLSKQLLRRNYELAECTSGSSTIHQGPTYLRKPTAEGLVPESNLLFLSHHLPCFEIKLGKVHSFFCPRDIPFSPWLQLWWEKNQPLNYILLLNMHSGPRLVGANSKICIPSSKPGCCCNHILLMWIQEK